MSRITHKNLSYETTVPRFLSRMMARAGFTDYDEHTAMRAHKKVLPRKKKNADQQAEEQPVYVDEHTGDTLTKMEWEAKEAAADGERQNVDLVRGGIDGGIKEKEEISANFKERKDTERVAAIGTARKRKAGKLVGVEINQNGEPSSTILPTKSARILDGKTRGSGNRVAKGKAGNAGKKVKLSFDD